jgi:CSLREA domain-containing protein
MKPIWRILLVGLVALAVPALSPIPASAATFMVNSTGDGGDSSLADGVCNDGTNNCTLRAAIQQANNTVDQDTIEFNITPDTIAPASQLPPISDPLIIDGISDPDSARVELVGTGAGLGADGLSVDAQDSIVKGLVIRNFSNDGINITADATGVRIESNFIGTDATGAVDFGNGSNGIDVAGAANTIGGTGVGNLISGNGDSGTGSGIRITGAGANANIVQGNFIGTSANGVAPAIANDDHGIVITSSAHDNLIGGTTAASRNVISGNGQDGIRIQGAGVSNTIQGNFIGTDSSGTAALPNAADGVGFRTSASSNFVGGTATGAGNVISGNTDDGIQVGGTPGDTTTIRNGILGNSTFSNGTLGIDLLGGNGVDLNVAGDADTGANNVQNFPVLTSAASSATTTTISGTLNSEASKTYRLEFFSNDACDSSGNGEGQRFLGTTSVTTDSSGNVSFTASSLTGGAAGQTATATATEELANNTSEFSACTPVAVDTTPPVTGPPAPPPPPPAPPPPPVRCPGFQSDTRAQFVGSAGNDVLEGTSGRDIICGLGGNDTIRGLGRGDVLIGGAGSDVLIGGRGNDIVRGGRGRDIVRGGRGRDIVRGGRGRDTLLGGRSADTLLGGRGNDALRGGPRRDVLDGGRGRDRCRGGRGNDVLRRCEE